MQVTTIGLDLAKNVFQVHGISKDEAVVFNRPLRRAQVLPFFAKLEPCLIGMESCSSAHHWARELSALGHDVRLIPPIYVKPYVKRGKSDAIDAEAICEAVTRPTMRFVVIKTVEQQSLLSLHRARDLLVRQRTQLINGLRGLVAEFGIYIPRGFPEYSSSTVTERGYSVKDVAVRLGISTKSLYTWMAQFSKPQRQMDQKAEVRRLKKELARVTDVRTIEPSMGSQFDLPDHVPDHVVDLIA